MHKSQNISNLEHNNKLMLSFQQTLDLSAYSEVFDLVVPKDNFWRQLKESSDFSEVVMSVAHNYSLTMGRTAIQPEKLLKLLIIKEYYEWSDADTIAEVQVNLALRLFAGIALDEQMPCKATLGVFRRQRLKDNAVCAELLNASIKAAVKAGVIKVDDHGRKLINAAIDATHTQACCPRKWACDLLPERCRKLSAAIVACELIHWDEPIEVPSDMDDTQSIDFACNMLDALKSVYPQYAGIPAINRIVNRMEEEIAEFKDHAYTSSLDKDARVGHKSSSRTFFGYKTHILADMDSGIVIAESVSSGSASDTLEGEALIEQVCQDNTVIINTLVGDAAYSSSTILKQSAKYDFELIATPNSSLGTCKAFKHGFVYVKDADSLQCPAGHLSSHKQNGNYKKKNGSKYGCTRYFFNAQICEQCPLKEQCYVGKSKSKVAEVAKITDLQKDLLERQNTDDFKEKFKRRSGIERLNGDIKQNQSMRTAMAPGLQNMTLQSAIALFTYNMRTILRKIKR